MRTIEEITTAKDNVVSTFNAEHAAATSDAAKSELEAKRDSELKALNTELELINRKSANADKYTRALDEEVQQFVDEGILLKGIVFRNHVSSFKGVQKITARASVKIKGVDCVLVLAGQQLEDAITHLQLLTNTNSRNMKLISCDVRVSVGDNTYVNRDEEAVLFATVVDAEEVPREDANMTAAFRKLLGM